MTETAQTMPVASSGPLGMFFFHSYLHFLLTKISFIGTTTYKVVRFEKSGATALAEHNGVINFGQPSLGAVSFPHAALIREHFRMALILHFRGFGRRATAGFKSQLL